MVLPYQMSYASPRKGRTTAIDIGLNHHKFWRALFAFDFVQNGHDVTVLTAKPNYPKGKFYKGYGFFSKRSEEYKGVRIIRTPIVPRRSGGALFLALNYVSFIFFAFFTSRFRLKGDYDIIFCHLTSPITSALPAIWLKKRFR